MKKFNLVLFAGLLLTLTSCSVQSSTVKTIYLDHYLVECAGPFLRLCHLDKEDAGDTWSYRYSNVSGLEYEWGYTYELRVREERIQIPSNDGPNIETTLLDVLSKERVTPDTRFQIELTTQEGTGEFAERYIVQKATDLFEFHRVKTFTCSEEVCAQLSALLNDNMKITFEFTYPENLGDPLIAQRIVSTEVLPEN